MDFFIIGKVVITALLAAFFFGFALERHKINIFLQIVLCALIIPTANSLGWSLPDMIATNFRFDGERIWTLIFLCWGAIFSFIPSVIGYFLGIWISRIQK
jgi:hypothetical protein